MPNIVIQIPSGVFSVDCRSELVGKINEAAAIAEQIPNDPKKRFLCWVLIEEVPAGAWTCGTVAAMPQLVPCIARIDVPAGVLDDDSRAQYVRLVHNAFRQALPEGDKRQVITSVLLNEVADGTWGVNGAVWRLEDFAKAAGFAHLQTA